MKIKIILLPLIFLLTISNTTLKAQSSMSDFSFVQVPEFYSFLNENDQYQLNSMTKFYLNKYGFNAYFGNEVPNLRKCEGLYAEVLGKPGFIYTEITILIKDCNGMEVFRSAIGKSKEKEFKKAYQEAMRNAFESFQDLGIQQKDIDISVIEKSSTQNARSDLSKNSDVMSVTAAGDNLPNTTFSSYYKDGTPYLLRKTSDGYTLYQEVKGAEDDLMQVGKIIINGTKVTYKSIMDDEYEAKFTASKSLSIASAFKP